MTSALLMLALLSVIVYFIYIVALSYARDKKVLEVTWGRREFGWVRVVGMLIKVMAVLTANRYLTGKFVNAADGKRLIAIDNESVGKEAPTLLVVFVHGTFASGEYDQRWRIAASVISQARPGALFRGFHWGGKNTEASRRSEGEALANAILDWSKTFPGTPVLAVGHSHGGSLIVHALRFLPTNFRIKSVLLGAPLVNVTAKEADIFHARLTAFVYASAVFTIYFVAFLIMQGLHAAGFPKASETLESVSFVLGLVFIAWLFMKRKDVRLARERLLRPIPDLRHSAYCIWCSTDEMLSLFRVMARLQAITNSLRGLVNERIIGLRQSSPLAWVGHLASVGSLVLLMMNVGIAQVCRATLKGLSFFEGILVEIGPDFPEHDGVMNYEVNSETKPNLFARVHSGTINDPAVLSVLQLVIASRSPL